METNLESLAGRLRKNKVSLLNVQLFAQQCFRRCEHFRAKKILISSLNDKSRAEDSGHAA
jgi:hypothetical protein